MMSPCKDCPDRHPTCHGSCEAYKEWLNRFHEAKARSEKQRYGLWVPTSYAREKTKNANMKNPQRWR